MLYNRLPSYPALALIAFFGFLPAVSALAEEDGATVDGERMFFAMGTWLTVQINAVDRDTFTQGSEDVLAAFKAVDARWSTWREDSELARIHAAVAGTPVKVSDAFAREWSAVAAWSKRTGGMFQPLVGQAMDPVTHQPLPTDEGELAWGTFSVVDGVARRGEGVRIAEGGFAKGLALDLAMDSLRKRSGIQSAMLNIGGQLAVLGRKVEVEVAHPTQRHEAHGTIEISAGSVATSGNSERKEHVIDPLTGRVCTEQGSFTVWAPNALAADCLSTAGLVLGHQGVERLSDRKGGVACLYLDADGRPTMSSPDDFFRLIPGAKE